ncbi:MAG TPA: DUF1858 domain-containing protein [Firmicutes bacterium]|nr:DUF1858 domain-containing protein [Bacillota bacterium]
MANRVTKDTLIGEVLDMDMQTAAYFLEMGMHCLGCPASRGETLEQACMVHGVNCDELVNEINKYFAASEVIKK